MKKLSTLIGLCLVLLGLSAIHENVAVAQVATVTGKVTLKQADGAVTVNGQAAQINSDIASDSSITTAKGSSAVVSLGKLGRVELMPETTMKLVLTDSGATAMIDAGRVRVSSSSGVVVKTDDGEIVAIQKDTGFIVDVRCGDTVVSTQSGKVELRAGNTVKQIAAGSQDSAGQARPGCKR